jgi:hypothetical protein
MHAAVNAPDTLVIDEGEQALADDVGRATAICSASVTSSCVLSFTLLGERLLHFQLNRNSAAMRKKPTEFVSSRTILALHRTHACMDPGFASITAPAILA